MTPPAIIVVGDVVDLRETLSWFETKPLFGWRVLVPRTKEQAGTVSTRLRGYGAVPEEVPTISVEPPRNPLQMDKAVRGLVEGRYEWIAFTSVNAVKAVREKFEEYGLDARAFSGLKIAAVGDKTAEAIAAWGLRADLVPSGEQSAAGLLADWPEYDDVLDPINRVFLPRADIATETLVAGLIDLGWECDDVTAYRTVRATPPPAPTRDAIKTGKFDAVVFTSSSTVRNLVGIAGKPHPSTIIAVIGPATAKTAEEHGLRVDVLAPKPDVHELVDALADFGATRRLAMLDAGQPVTKPSERKPRPPEGQLEAWPRRGSSRSSRTVGPVVRPRRLRRTPSLRRLVAETSLEARQLVLPMFVREGLDEPRPIRSMPGVVQHTRGSLLKAAVEAAELGLGGVMLFGIPEHKDAVGSGATDPTGVLNLAITDVVAEVGDGLTVMSDLCLDEFTDHGHCGLLTVDGQVDNDKTLAAYAQMAIAQASAGVDMVGPSGMMDGQVAVVRSALDSVEHSDVSILAYSAKYSSAFFGPFREAVDSSLEGDRRTYQQDPANAVEGVREALLDVEQGADIVMVKPALRYLDVVRRVRDAVDVPVAAYNVSGEYAMVEAAAANGWIDREAAILETLTSIRRAGADVVLTYWAAEAARLLRR